MSEHRELREQLGWFALGHGTDEERLAVQAHLDGCPACRAELAQLTPLAAALARVDPDRLDDAPVLPAELGEAIFDQIDAERALVAARARRRATDRGRLRTGALLVASCAAALAVGFALATQVRDVAPPGPREAVAVRALDTGVEVAEADVIPHTWGVEIQLAADGFERGAVYRAAVIDRDGVVRPAGEFIGTGEDQLRCNLNSSVLREDATGFEIVDERGEVVLTSSF